MAELEVISSGIFTSIQDAGRVGFGHYGVPKSGALDQGSMRRANALLGNKADASVLEITFTGPQLRFSAPTSIAICGAVLDIYINDQLAYIDELIEIPKNAIVKIGKATLGVRSYLAIAGGFQGKEIMGSHSWSRQLSNPFRLTKGMLLRYPETSSFHGLKDIPDSTSLNTQEFKVLPGPEFQWLSEKQRGQLFSQPFQLLPTSDRMAFSFSSESLLPYTERAFITGPVLPGVVQWYPNGQLVLLHRGAQRTGGYPRVLVFGERELDEIAQIGIGVEFRMVL